MGEVHVIGAGLAGSEAAWQLAERGLDVILHEMRPATATAAHKSDAFAELVCSNSFRSDDAQNNAVGVLHEELRRANSLIMSAADRNQVPAGGALAVDRHRFSAAVSEQIRQHKRIRIHIEMIDHLPPADWGHTIIATGPLTAGPLAGAIQSATGHQNLAFFDAIAPIIHTESINFDITWFQSRYDKVGPTGSTSDYINCPLNKLQYEAFIAALLDADTVPLRDWEQSTPYFDGCLPIEEMARRGPETLRHGPLKPVGLTNPHQPDNKPYAIVQLRQDNQLGTLYNMVGMQTKLKYGEQARILRMIPGLENAEFARLGGIHRNFYIHSPAILDPYLRLTAMPHLLFAGQITGCEGYVESTAIGLLAGYFVAELVAHRTPTLPPATSAMGALLHHITGGHLSGHDHGPASFQPMNINFGLFPPIEPDEHPPRPRKNRDRRAQKNARRQALCERALHDFDQWINGADQPRDIPRSQII